MWTKIIFLGVILFIIFIVLNTLPFLPGFILSFSSISNKGQLLEVDKPLTVKPSPPAVVSSPLSAPQPRRKHTELFHYYPVRGTTYKELKEQLKIVGPKDSQGIVRYAVTNWDMNPSFKYKRDGENCFIEWFEPKLTLSVTLPRWENMSESADSDTKESWNKFLDVLENHESLHVEIAIDEVYAMLSEIKQIATEKECLKTGNKAMNIFEKYKQSLIDKENDFDKETSYGWTQGVK